jgi:hypothetical protein
MQYRSRTRALLTAAVSAVAMLAGMPSAPASTIAPMSIAEMADYSGQVIVGTVSAVRSYWADNPRRIESQVTFGQVEYLKAPPSKGSQSFTLTVPGGEVGTMQMRVCCAPAFAVGDKWLLFVLPTYKTFPVVGVYRGAFLVRPDDDGVERLYYARHGALTAVTGIAPNGMVQEASRHGASPLEHLHSATNVRVIAPSQEKSDQAISLSAFIEQVRPVLDGSEDHRLTEPAGRRIVVKPPVAPLQLSSMQKKQDARGVDDDRVGLATRSLGVPRQLPGANRSDSHNAKEGEQ